MAADNLQIEGIAHITDHPFDEKNKNFFHLSRRIRTGGGDQ